MKYPICFSLGALSGSTLACAAWEKLGRWEGGGPVQSIGFTFIFSICTEVSRSNVLLQGPPLQMQNCAAREIYVLRTEQRHYGTGLSVSNNVTVVLPLPREVLGGTWSTFYKHLFINASVM